MLDQSQKRRESWPERLQRAGLLTLFAFVLLVPKALGLRRRPRVWNALRTAVALLGVALVIVPTTPTTSPVAAAIGLALFLSALLATPAKPEKSVDERARKLGALVVVNGGKLFLPGGEPVPTRLLVAPDRVAVLDADLEALLDIAFCQVSSIRAEQAPKGWKLRVEWDSSTTEFFYDGFFAEHLARVAENTLLSQIRRELPILN